MMRLIPHLAFHVLLIFAAACSVQADDVEFPQAIEPREFVFPRDHGSHSEYKTEWWYLTGKLQAEDERLFGFQATWFRSGLTPYDPVQPRKSRLATRQLFFFHGALTDVAAQRFQHVADAARGALNWAGASEEDLDVWLLDHRFVRDGDVFRTDFRVEGRRVELELRPQREPLFHGVTPGLSQKGPQPGQASYYYTLTRMRATGTVEEEPGGAKIPVTGSVWLDREFGSNQLDDTQVGWDWFSVTLSDGSDLMLYQIRLKDGGIEPHSSGTFRTADGSRSHISRESFTIEVLDRWTSKASGATYPARWRIRVPTHGIDLRVRPLLANQELRTGGNTEVDYWEGLSEFVGEVNGVEVQGHGYIELVGYNGAIRGL